MDTLTVADLPESMRAETPAIPTPVRATPVRVLTCEHGPACPTCVLAAARVIVEHDATLTGEVYTG